MKLSNEVKVGFLAAVALAVFIGGFNFLKGRNVFSRATTLYAEYDKTEGLAESSIVTINGLKVGTVTHIYLKEDGSGRIMVEMEINAGVKIPKQSIAKIKSPDLMGSKMVALEFETGCNEESCLVVDGDTLKGTAANLLESMLGAETTPLLKNINGVLGTVDSTISQFKGGAANGEVDAVKGDVKTVIANIKKTTDDLQRIMAASAGSISASTKSLASITSNVERNNGKINSVMANAEGITADAKVFSSKLKNVEINQTLERANAAIAEITRTLESLKTSMKGIDKTVSTFNTTLSSINETIANVNKGQGTLGALMSDRKLYDDIALTVADLQLLAQDVRLHPERYRTILSGKKKPYKVTPDPAKSNYIETPGGK